VEETKRIIGRLPSFYNTWDEGSLFFQFIDSISEQIHESRKDMFQIMRYHWVDTASAESLEKIGELYEMQRLPGEDDYLFRKRIKSAILGYKGGGTVDSIMSLTKSLLGAQGDEIQLIENPLGPVQAEYELESGDSWALTSDSIQSEVPEIQVLVETSGASLDSAKFDESIFPLAVTNPKFTNLETGETIGFKGVLEAGRTLRTFMGRAMVDDIDSSEQLTTPTIPGILRSECRWRYNESVTERVGAFDSATFDQSLFRIPVAKVKVTLSWMAHLAATFELRIKKKALSRNGLSQKDVEEFVSKIKGAGVKHIVTIVD
jgi:hypothetical protein